MNAANKQIVQDLTRDIWNSARPELIDRYYASDYHDNTAPFGAEPGVEGLRAAVSAFMGGFSEIRMSIGEQVAEGDRVASFLTFVGRHTGPFFGEEPTGREVMITALRMDRLRDGKVVEHWACFDLASLQQQISTSA